MTSCNKLKSFKVVKLTDENLINDGKDVNGGEASDEDGDEGGNKGSYEG